MSLRTAELTRLRSDVAAFMNETCEIYHRTLTADGQGGTAVTVPETASATTVCRRIPISSKEQRQGGGTPLVNVDRLQVPHNAPIVETDLLVIGSDRFEVIGIIDREPHISQIITVTRIA